MPSYIPIEERYNYKKIIERGQLNVFAGSGIATAIGVAAGVGALGTVAGGLLQSQAAGKAAKAQEKQTEFARQQAAEVTPEARQKQMEAFLPGAAEQRQFAFQQANQMLRGEIPKDVQQQIMRNIAEVGGAGFNPFTAGQVGGFQTSQGLLARQLGLTSLDLQMQGQGLAADWQALAGNFVNQVGSERMKANALALGAGNQAIGARYAANAIPGQTVSQIGGGLMNFGTGLATAALLGGAGGGSLAQGGGQANVRAVSNPNTQYFARSLYGYG